MGVLSLAPISQELRRGRNGQISMSIPGLKAWHRRIQIPREGAPLMAVTSTALDASAPSFLATRRGKLTLALLCIVAFLDFIDVVNVALPVIRRDLHVSVQDLQWVPSGYLLTYGGFMLLGGRAADLLSRAVRIDHDLRGRPRTAQGAGRLGHDGRRQRGSGAAAGRPADPGSRLAMGVLDEASAVCDRARRRLHAGRR